MPVFMGFRSGCVNPLLLMAQPSNEASLFPENFPVLQERFPWLRIAAVLVDARACIQDCLDLIWEAGALRLVDICTAAAKAPIGTIATEGAGVI